MSAECEKCGLRDDAASCRDCYARCRARLDRLMAALGDRETLRQIARKHGPGATQGECALCYTRRQALTSWRDALLRAAGDEKGGGK